MVCEFFHNKEEWNGRKQAQQCMRYDSICVNSEAGKAIVSCEKSGEWLPLKE